MTRYGAIGVALVVAAAIPWAVSAMTSGEKRPQPRPSPATDVASRAAGSPPPPRTQAVPYWKRCVTGRRCVRAVSKRVFGDGWPTAFRIAHCETGGTFYHRALGDAGERGIWQLHPVHFGWLEEERLWDVRYNARAAYRLSERGTDWSPWSCA